MNKFYAKCLIYEINAKYAVTMPRFSICINYMHNMFINYAYGCKNRHVPASTKSRRAWLEIAIFSGILVGAATHSRASSGE